MTKFRVFAKITALLVVNTFLPLVHAHENSTDQLVVEDGYLWFPKEYKTNTAVITNSTGNIAVDKCDIWNKNNDATGFIVASDSSEEEELALTLERVVIEDYLASIAKRSQIKEGLEKISELASAHSSGSVNVSIKKFISVKIAKNNASCFLDSNVEGCQVDVVDSCSKKLMKLPDHYFSNEQMFVLTESIYPKSIIIGSGDESVEIETIVDSESVSQNQIKDGVWPLVSKIQYITEHDGDDAHTGQGSATIRTGAIQNKRKSAGKKKITFHWKGR